MKRFIPHKKIRFTPYKPADNSDEHATRAPQNLYYFHPNHLGTGTLITNGGGEPYQYFVNLPYGETLYEKGGYDYDNPYKFNGKELDQETGLYYYGARYYDPETSIWLSVDPLAEKYPGINPYVYTAANPINLVDPDGKTWKDPNKAKKLKNKSQKKILSLENNITKYQEKLSKKNIGRRRRIYLKNKIKRSKNRIRALKQNIINIDLLGKDKNNVYDLKNTSRYNVVSSEAKYKHHVKKGDDGVIYIEGANDGLFIHEIAHVALYLQNNKPLKFSNNNILLSLFPYGARDEVYSYAMQWGFSPNSVPFYINETGVPDIRKIAALKDENDDYVYPMIRKGLGLYY